MDVNTTTGPVRGATNGKVTAFRGIPYATAERFRPPTPPRAWTEPRDATKPGPEAPQLQSRLSWVMGERELDWAEDGCLNLNVWTTDTTAKKAVLVWFHGGGFTSGSGGWDWYDGTNLAGHNDIVVVTANYRLGALGYLYKPEIGADNLGPQDQGAVLRWVRDNIAAFGGDPDQVTVGGQSAGAYSALYLAIDPATKDLVHRLVLESGPWALPPTDPATAAKTADRFLDALGEDPEKATAEQILATVPKLAEPGMAAPPLMPVLGGAGYPRPWTDADLSGLDVLIGHTKDEMVAFGGGPDIFEQGVHEIAKATDGFAYRFDRSGPLGAPHCVELPYLFGTFVAFRGSPMMDPRAAETDFGTAVADFTRTGDPGWNRYPEFRHFV
ncbi:carboxylesterase family protein [Kutzneria sp. NPDC051319]|uniref:carboxylesterase family protein n=1 Tax=Kutzneria sp. NPDC051319 TaxID=3155047 RepID=UPI00342DE3EA